jgi:hypothetical protein
VTADATEELIRQALLLHAYSVIPKPVSKNVVIYTVVRALGRTYGLPAPTNRLPPPGPSPHQGEPP